MPKSFVNLYKDLTVLGKRGLGCADGCQTYPKNPPCTGNCACIHAYGDMFKLKMDTWGNTCCPTGCGKAEGKP